MLKFPSISSRSLDDATPRFTAAFAVLTVALLIASVPSSAKAGDEKRETADVIAEFLRRFPGFMKPAKERFAGPGDPIVIGVLGESPIAEKLRNQLRDVKVRKRPLLFRSIAFDPNKPIPEAEIRSCHFLFLSRSCRPFEQEILRIAGKTVATFANWPNFAKHGGVLEFSLEEDQTLGLIINRKAAKRAKLRIRADLLKIAQLVEEERPDPKARESTTEREGGATP